MAQARAYDGPTPPVLAGYQVEELVGVGGTGEVWRARDVLSGRLVALKRLRHDGPPVERDRLRREAAVLAGLSSPHIVRLITVVTSAEGLVLVLDYQGGGSLASLLATRPVLSPGEVVTLAAPLGAALAEVHALGMVHGDISPANILLATDGRPVLSDLGVARLVGRTATSPVTTAFADPAVLAGAPFTPASDVYSLAAVCFTALTGEPPVPDDGPGARPPLAVVAPDVPEALASVVDAALHPDVVQRLSAAAFSAQLLEAVAAEPVRLAGASVPVSSPPTSAVRRLPAPPQPVSPEPSRAERLAAALGRLRMTPRRLTTLAAVPVAVGAAIWGGVAWARSTSAGAPAWTAPPVHSGLSVSPAAVEPEEPLGPPGTPDPAPGRAAGARAGRTPVPSGPPRSGRLGVAPTSEASVSVSPAPDAVATSARAITPTPDAVAPARVTRAAPAHPGGSTNAGRTDWLAVVRALDRARDAAFDTGDTALLEQVYAPGSAPLAQDRRLLAGLLAAGEHAAGLSLVASRVQVGSTAGGHADLLVTDTLAPYALVSRSGTEVPVAGRGSTTWRIRLVRTSAGWRMTSVAAA